MHPQYNMLNVGYQLIVQIFERIENGQYPPYIDQYMTDQGITKTQVLEQQKLIADLLDGLFAKEYTRDPSMTYMRAAMQQCNWKERFDWKAMAVFDMLASQSFLTYYFLTIADLASAEDVAAQNPGQLREIVGRLAKRATTFLQDDAE